MSEYVAPLRFVNTPTVMEVWEQSQTKEPELPEKDEDELSKEYDDKGDVTGTESFYRFIIQEARVQPRRVDGNEGFFETIGKGFNAFIENIKKFFKWIFSFFGNSSAQIERTTEKAEKAIEVKGVDKDPVPYPKDYTRIWDGSGNPGSDIGWVTKSLSKVNEVITKQLEPYLKEVQKYIDDVNHINVNVKDGMLSNAKEDMDKARSEHISAINKLFKDGPFIGGVVLDIADNGKLIGRANGKITKAKKGVTLKFQPTAAGNLAVLKAARASNKLSSDATKKITDMETNVVKGLNESIKFASSLDVKDSTGAKLVASGVKSMVTTAMANLSFLQELIAKCIRAAATIGCTGVVYNQSVDKDLK